MSKRLLAALFAASSTFFAGNAVADDYTIKIGRPPTGSIIPPGRVGLGIKVGIDKSWDKLSAQEQQAWREYTELTDPQVTPPFPVPDIRGLLNKLKKPERFNFTESLTHSEQVLLIVRVTETGEVRTVDIMEGSDGAKKLSDNDKLLAYVYINALMSTKFSPAMFNGQAAPSAFPMRVSQTTKMQ